MPISQPQTQKNTKNPLCADFQKDAVHVSLRPNGQMYRRASQLRTSMQQQRVTGQFVSGRRFGVLCALRGGQAPAKGGGSSELRRTLGTSLATPDSMPLGPSSTPSQLPPCLVLCVSFQFLFNYQRKQNCGSIAVPRLALRSLSGERVSTARRPFGDNIVFWVLGFKLSCNDATS